MSKKTIIIVIAAVLMVALGVGGYFYWSKKLKTNTGNGSEAAGPAEKLTESATKGVLPSIQTNPLENKPDINPADKANPYTNIKTNPF
ncbi:MAG: hypothetical protein Q8P63_03210 [Candidatus Nealsonbacteria bacterium]|nr:hypothetical protein [Candidatus Nealsonbacteria bacterium]